MAGSYRAEQVGASATRGNPVTPGEQRKKLELVVEVARKVWG